ncbi:MAG: polysaccharide deacetylase family protein, partial [Ferruginibacter sp.]
ALFEKIMHFVSKQYEVLSLEDICLNNPVTKKPALAISFDDGYRDFIDHALPVLKKYRFHSTMFVVTDCIDNNMPTWTYVMDFLFYHTNKLLLPPYDYGDDNKPYAVYAWNNKEEQIMYCRKFKQALKKVNNKKRNEILQHFIHGFDDVQLPKNLMMTWDELASMKKELVDIGSHSISHPPLATIDDEAELENEIRVSGEIIEQRLGFFPAGISYPVGSYDQRVKEVSKNAGYKFGVAVDQKLYNSIKQDLFEVPRIELYNDSFLRNKIKIYGIETAIKSMIKR